MMRPAAPNASHVRMIVPRFPWSEGRSNTTTTESSSTGILERSSGGISMRAISSDGFSCFPRPVEGIEQPRWKLEVSTSRRAVQHLPREARQLDVARVVQGVDFPSETQRLPDGRNALDEELAVLLAFRAAAAEGSPRRAQTRCCWERSLMTCGDIPRLSIVPSVKRVADAEHSVNLNKTNSRDAGLSHRPSRADRGVFGVSYLRVAAAVMSFRTQRK